MDNIVEMNRILVIRNDTNTNWERSTYILERGEIGIAWFGGKAIIKVGNGSDVWSNLPQSDYVLTEDQILTYNFGKHKIANGSVNAGGNGEFFSNWFFNALREEKEPNIVSPDLISFTITEIGTDSGTYEIGSQINKIVWDATPSMGLYEYGTKEDKNNTIPKLTTYYQFYFGTSLQEESESLDDMTKEHNPHIDMLEEGLLNNNNWAPSLVFSWGDSKNVPVTNIGNEAQNKIWAGSKKLTQDPQINCYREGCFFGTINDEITEEAIRAMYKTGSGYARGVYTFDVPVGAENIVIAYDARYAGPISILNTTVNAEMINNFVESEMTVGGYNNYDPISYKVLIYTPAEPYKNSANIKITLG